MERKTKLSLAILFVIIVIIAFAYIMFGMIKENSQCIANPFVYANKQIVNTEGDHIYSMCSCNVLDGGFYFDDKGMYQDNPLTTENPVKIEINYTERFKNIKFA